MSVDITYRGHKLSTLPEILSTSRTAARVDLSQNLLADLRPNEFQVHGLLDLDLSYNCYASVPSVLSVLTSLTRLAMTNNKLSEGLPPLLAALPLQRLELSHNNIKSTGASFACMSKLTALHLAANLLREVPGDIKHLVKLQEADFSSNDISAIHRDISKCTSLRILKASNNQLETYPCSLCDIHSLESLDLACNRLIALQGRLFEWTSLRHLDISNNNIHTLPSALGWLDLETLELSDNPNLNLPEQMFSFRGSQIHAIRSYLQIVCEQHRLIDKHLTQFSTKPGQNLPSNFILADPRRALSARRRRHQDYTALNSVAAAVQRAAQDRILDLRCCGLQSLPDISQDRRLSQARVLDARYNSLKSAAPAVDMEGLVILNVAHNKLTKLADTAGKWENLAVLCASFNQLTSLPSDMSSAKRLQQMYVSGNLLSSLPDSIATLPLVDLFLAENKFIQVPRCVYQLTTICKLSLSCNFLTMLPAAIGSLTTLQFLDVSFNQLDTLPSEVSSLRQLEALNLSFNPIGKLSSGMLPRAALELVNLKELNLDYTGCCEMDLMLGQLMSLKALKMDGNNLQQPWRSLYDTNPLLLVHVHSPVQQVLNLSGCGLEELPACMVLMRSLRELDLSNNKLRVLPRLLSELPHLCAICLDDNPLEPRLAAILQQGAALGPGEGEGALMALLSPTIDVLALTSLQLTSCPPEVLWHSAVLKHLSLSNNLLTTLPLAISSCCRLERLNLESNRLTVVPEAVFSLSALRVLQLTDNSIKVMPARIANLRGLRVLLVGNNQLQSFGPGITSLRSLVGLSTPGNCITTVPDEISNMTALRILDVASNQLTTLPESCSQLRRLQLLRMSHNALHAIPVGLANLPNLSDLAIRGNPVAEGIDQPNASTRPEVEALLVEMLRLQAVVVTKQRPFAGMRHQVSMQASQSAGGHLRTSHPVPQETRDHAKSQKHVDDMLIDLLTQLSEDEGNEECGSDGCVQESAGCQRSVSIKQPQQQSPLFDNVYSNAAYVSADERPAQEQLALGHTLQSGSENAAEVRAGHGTDDCGASQEFTAAEDSKELQKQLERVGLERATAAPPGGNGKDSTLLGQRAVVADANVRGTAPDITIDITAASPPPLCHQESSFGPPAQEVSEHIQGDVEDDCAVSISPGYTADAQGIPNDSHHSSPGQSTQSTGKSNHDADIDHQDHNFVGSGKPNLSLWQKAGAAHGVRPVNVKAQANPLTALSPDELIKTLKAAPKPPDKSTGDGERKRPQARDRAARVAASQMARLDLLLSATKDAIRSPRTDDDKQPHNP